jgi:uncharacterized membrane protein YfcA
MSITEIIALIIAGLCVGFINTLAGGGSIISLSLLMFLGLPAPVANGTNRIAITIQTLTASLSFNKKKVLDKKKGIKLAIPTVIGSLLGSWIATDINEKVFERAMAVILLIMLFFILFKPNKYIYGKEELVQKPVNIWQILLFFGIGLYGGFIHVGVGYFLLASLVLSAGYDLVHANALKVFLVLLYAPVTLLVFLFNDQVEWAYGLIMTIGNVTGAIIASRLAVSKGVVFVKWVIIIVILVTSGKLFGLYNWEDVMHLFAQK